MKTKEENKEKTFDAVNFMLVQRDRISKDIMDLSPEEIVSYFEKKPKGKSESKNLIREWAKAAFYLSD